MEHRVKAQTTHSGRQNFCDIISSWKIVTSSPVEIVRRHSERRCHSPLRYSFPFPIVQRVHRRHYIRRDWRHSAVSQSLSQSVSRQVKQTEIQFKVILHLLHNSEASAERSRAGGAGVSLYAKRYVPHSAWEIRAKKKKHSLGPRYRERKNKKPLADWLKIRGPKVRIKQTGE